DPAVRTGHDREPLVLHQDRDQPRRADARRPGSCRPRRARGGVLAGVRGERQGTGPRSPHHVPHLRGTRLGSPVRHRRPVRPGPATALLAAQAPWWEPGTVYGYHALTFGHLLGEIVRRVSGKSLTEFVASEIAGPLGADFQIGARQSDWARCADVIPPPPIDFDLSSIAPDSLLVKMATGPAPNAAAANTACWRQAEIGAANGHGNARSVARILSAVSLGGAVNGVRLLSQETIDHVFREQIRGTNEVTGGTMRLGIGY